LAIASALRVTVNQTAALILARGAVLILLGLRNFIFLAGSFSSCQGSAKVQ
jgi:hypothetical protein